MLADKLFVRLDPLGFTLLLIMLVVLSLAAFLFSLPQEN